jgi:hypothetical protein
VRTNTNTIIIAITPHDVSNQGDLIDALLLDRQIPMARNHRWSHCGWIAFYASNQPSLQSQISLLCSPSTIPHCKFSLPPFPIICLLHFRVCNSASCGQALSSQFGFLIRQALPSQVRLASHHGFCISKPGTSPTGTISSMLIIKMLEINRS